MSPTPQVFKGKEGIVAYYHNIYQQQWDDLYLALQQQKDSTHYFDTRGIGVSHVSSDAPSYTIDKSSYLAVLHIYTLLQSYFPQEQILHVLDMCAAPGGKSLALLHLCVQNQFSVHITLNEKSKNRYHRLQHNIQSFFYNLYDDKMLNNCEVRFENRDGALFGKHQKNKFDLVIADVPCSNTQHVLHNKKELGVWNSKHNKRLSIQQTGLLCAAIDACNTNGIICYMTCSIDPQENHCVIEKVLKKRSVSPIEMDIYNTEYSETEYSETIVDTVNLSAVPYGTLIIPSVANNIGPLYICLLHKDSGGGT